MSDITRAPMSFWWVLKNPSNHRSHCFEHGVEYQTCFLTARFIIFCKLVPTDTPCNHGNEFWVPIFCENFHWVFSSYHLSLMNWDSNWFDTMCYNGPQSLILVSSHVVCCVQLKEALSRWQYVIQCVRVEVAPTMVHHIAWSNHESCSNDLQTW